MRNKPIRIQRKRTKGWKMPPNTIYVGRRGKWGNPFRIGKPLRSTIFMDGPGFGGWLNAENSHFYRLFLNALPTGYTSKMKSQCPHANCDSNHFNAGDIPTTKEEIIALHVALLLSYNPDLLDRKLAELKGKNLACWCPLDQPCHADILLKLANE